MPGHVLIVAQTLPEPTPPDVVRALVGVADQMAGDATAVILRRRVWTTKVGRLLEDLDERARTLQLGFDAEADRLAGACAEAAAQAGLELKVVQVDLADDALERLTALARSHDYCVLPLGPSAEDGLDVLAALLHQAGRPVVLVPDQPRSPPSTRWAHAVVAWTPSAKAARALKDAAPLLKKARTVSVLVVRDEAARSDPERAREAVRYLKARGIGANIVSVQAGGERVGQRIARFMDENAADLLVIGAPSKPHEADFRLHSTGTDLIGAARWAILIST